MFHERHTALLSLWICCFSVRYSFKHNVDCKYNIVGLNCNIKVIHLKKNKKILSVRPSVRPTIRAVSIEEASKAKWIFKERK